MEVLRNIPEEKQNDYKFIVTFLEMRYGEINFQEVYKVQLQGTKQKYNESLQEYEAVIMRLINLACPTYPEEIRQELAVNSFIEGVCDPETSQTLRIARLKKISEVFAYVLRFETAKQSSRNQGRIMRRVNVNANEEIFMRLMREMQEILNKRKI